MEIVKLYPECKDYVWGGTKLKQNYGKITDKTPCAESWELSFHKDGLTKLENGKTLAETVTAQDLGENVDSRIALFEALPSLTLDEVVKFQQENVKDRIYYYCILGDKNDLDIAALEKMGKVVYLTTEDIFGY